MLRRSAIPTKRVGVCEEEIQLMSSSVSEDKFSMITDEALSRRQIHIIDPISEGTFEQVKNLYDEMLEADQVKPIHFIIGTVGGDVRSMLGIMNLLLLSPVPCYTYIFGETCSAGSWIYLCGHKRFAPKTGLVSFMLHPMEWNSSDSLGNHNSGNAYVDKISQSLSALTLTRTKLTKRQLRKLATTETRYFVGKELFDFGIANEELTTTAFWFYDKPKKKKATQPLTEDKEA